MGNLAYAPFDALLNPLVGTKKYKEDLEVVKIYNVCVVMYWSGILKVEMLTISELLSIERALKVRYQCI